MNLLPLVASAAFPLFLLRDNPLNLDQLCNLSFKVLVEIDLYLGVRFFKIFQLTELSDIENALKHTFGPCQQQVQGLRICQFKLNEMLVQCSLLGCSLKYLGCIVD